LSSGPTSSQASARRIRPGLAAEMKATELMRVVRASRRPCSQV
jgi:hypothetical protein